MVYWVTEHDNNVEVKFIQLFLRSLITRHNLIRINELLFSCNQVHYFMFPYCHFVLPLFVY